MQEGETKKRLLLSKWRGGADRADIERRMNRLLEDIERLNNAVGKLNDQDEEIDRLKADLKERDEQIETLEAENETRDDDMVRTLEDVKYWLHDDLVMHRLVSDPRQLLRKVEDALG